MSTTTIVTLWSPRRPYVPGGTLAQMPGWERNGRGWAWVGPRSEAAAHFRAAVEQERSACGPCTRGAPAPSAYWGDRRVGRCGDEIYPSGGPWWSDPRTDRILERELTA